MNRKEYIVCSKQKLNSIFLKYMLISFTLGVTLGATTATIVRYV